MGGLRYLGGLPRANWAWQLAMRIKTGELNHAVNQAAAKRVHGDLLELPAAETTAMGGGVTHEIHNHYPGANGKKSDWPWIFLITLVLLLATAAGLLWYTNNRPTQQTPATPALVPGTEKIGISVQ